MSKEASMKEQGERCRKRRRSPWAGRQAEVRSRSRSRPRRELGLGLGLRE